MGCYKDVYGHKICPPTLPVAPPTPAPLPEPPKIDTSVTDRLADIYAQSFGKAAEGAGGQIAVVPVGPQQDLGSSGGSSLKGVLVLGGLAVGGYFLYKRFAA